MYRYLIFIIAFLAVQQSEAQTRPKADTSRLEKDTVKLREIIINTGYYQVPKERATGAFDHINKELLNRSTGSNILQRLEGISSSLHFDRRSNSKETANVPSLRVRGLSTIASNESPLIVVDNFPYEGDINNINPNDVESVTLLKDAAASSIWGARAGNGVIVITTKQGRYREKTAINLNTNVTISERPDLFYSPRWLPSELVMGFEKELFDKNTYSVMPETALSSYVELLFAKKNGTISENEFIRQETIMRNTDLRKQAFNHLYQLGVNQQYSLNINGGESKHKYYISAGMDNSRDFIIGNRNRRLTLSLQNSIKPIEALELTGSIWYARSNATNNGVNLSMLNYETTQVASPYTRLVDDLGQPLSIAYRYQKAYIDAATSQGLLPWNYSPLTDRELVNNTALNTELRFNGSARLNFKKYLNAAITYQYINGTGYSRSHFTKDSYEVRNLVNSLTQANGSRIIPYADILSQGGNNESITHSGRFQLNYLRQLGEQNFTALAGTEVRQQLKINTPGYILYNYNPEVQTGTATYNYEGIYAQRPSGSAMIPGPPRAIGRLTDRYLSWFANAAYNYMERYTLSSSIRWDGSNLFGVKTNQKGVPLWSAGLSWEISKEGFYAFSQIPYLRLRGTYGSSGNINQQVSAYPIIGYSTDALTKLPITTIRSAGNPGLRWEKVGMLSLGLDAASENKRIEASLEWYRKKASDLIGEKIMAPSSGIVPDVLPLIVNRINYANLEVKGVDLQLKSRNLTGDFLWESALLFSYVRNKVTNYNDNTASTSSFYFGSPTPLQVGLSRDVTYWLPWLGLDNQSGKPVIPDQYGGNYRTYHDLFPAGELQHGVAVAPYFGSLRNSFSWKGIQVSALIAFKGGYVFKRESMSTSGEYLIPAVYHRDYYKRWKQPGDEKFTDVPVAGSTDTYLNLAYNRSSALISKGDHIRLQDISISYTLKERLSRKLGLQKLSCYGYARNLGILWAANKHGLDPEYPHASYPEPSSYAIGLNINF